VRGLKSTIALVVVLIGLVAYIYFVDSKKPASDAPEAKAKAFTVDADQIEEIHIKPASGDASLRPEIVQFPENTVPAAFPIWTSG